MLRVLHILDLLYLKELFMKNFDNTRPSRLQTFLGFDDLFRTIEGALSAADARQSATSFPPYNIFRGELTGNITIEVALAGLKRSEVKVELDRKNDTLSISGGRTPRDHEAVVVMGIAERNFERKFFIADDLEVSSATMVDGLLTVVLSRVERDQDKPVQISID